MSELSGRIQQAFGAIGPFMQFLTGSSHAQRASDPAINDFVFGNPHEMPLAGFTAALQKWVVPQNKDWFAYKDNEAVAREAVVASLYAQRGVTFAPEDIFMTNGAFAAIAVTLATVVSDGDEVIFISPPWFFYEAMILHYGGKPVRVKIDMQSFDLDLAAIAAAITSRTRAIIVNSPHNPTGKIYGPETLQQLAGLLTEASRRNGRTIYLLSDEAYSRILFDGRKFTSATEFYPHSFLLYTYGKTLLTPGQRIGYIALPPEMPEREELRMGIFTAQALTGFAFPNALLQYALVDLEKLTIDVTHLQRKRDRLVGELREIGYRVTEPEGTFYLMVQAPGNDEAAFMASLEERDIFCLPGSVVEMPGYFRISLTANDAMIERALPGFATAYATARMKAEG